MWSTFLYSIRKNFASDVYSFDIIMVEVSTGKTPHGDVPHDEKLALAICNGLRPRVAKGTPKCYIDLVNQCLDANPENRPSAEGLRRIIRNWFESLRKVKNQKLPKNFLMQIKFVYNNLLKLHYILNQPFYKLY